MPPTLVGPHSRPRVGCKLFCYTWNGSVVDAPPPLMTSSSFSVIHILITRRRGRSHAPHGLKSLLRFGPSALALATCFLILMYIFSTCNLFVLRYHLHLETASSVNQEKNAGFRQVPHFPKRDGVLGDVNDKSNSKAKMGSHGVCCHDKELFHDQDVFLENYQVMKTSLKVFVYPHRRDDPFANVLLPVDFEPSGNYASESYFKKVLLRSHFMTREPSMADLFFLPFSIARLRHDPRVGVDGIQSFIRDYIFNISHQYTYWNRTGGADHFYVACHSIGRSAMEKAVEVRTNAIQIVCSSSYYLSSYVAHKDASLPQIWPRQGEGEPPNLAGRRSNLAFFAGSINSPVREKLLQEWANDSDISVNVGHVRTSYSDELLRSKFCLHVKGFEVNTARVGDALYYGCVPVLIATHYDLPFGDILDWQNFAIVVATLDIPLLKKILLGITDKQYSVLQENVLRVRKHFQWHLSPVDLDAFYMVMYELWLRRSSAKFLEY